MRRAAKGSATGAGVLIRRALHVRRARGAIALLGVATCVLLVLVLFSTFRSVAISVDAYIGQEGADIWVAPRGTDNLVRSSAPLLRLRRIDPVEAFRP